MPELAEIETVRKRVVRTMKGKKIREIVLEEEDRFLFAFAKTAAVRKALTGAKVTGAGRKGKYFWLELDRKPWPLFHLGMSGNVAILPAKSLKSGAFSRGWGGPKMWSEGKDGDARDRRLWFSRLLNCARPRSRLTPTIRPAGYDKFKRGFRISIHTVI